MARKKLNIGLWINLLIFVKSIFNLNYLNAVIKWKYAFLAYDVCGFFNYVEAFDQEGILENYQT